jgi:Ig-like domain from next to BRCA1 gene
MEELIMSVIKKWAFLIIIPVGLLLLAACTAAPAAPTAIPQASTVDVNALRTEVAQTIVANMTSQAASAVPSSTPTVEMSATPLDTQTPFASETPISGIGGNITVATAIPGPISVTPTWKVFPTITKTSYVDSAKLTSQEPKDGYIKNQGLPFPVKWTFLNTGMRTWNHDFYIKYVSGDVKAEDDVPVFLPDEVKQNSSVTLSTTLRTPHESGNLRSNWELVNDDGVAILYFYLLVHVP